MMNHPKHTKEVYNDGILQTVRRASGGGNKILPCVRCSGGRRADPGGGAADRISDRETEEKEKEHLQALVVLGAGGDRDGRPGGMLRRENADKADRKADRSRCDLGSPSDSEADSRTHGRTDRETHA